jgi:predicted transcriptional regulator
VSPEYLKSKKAVQEYVKENFGSESDEDASVRRAKATVFLDQLEQHVRNSPEKSKVVYEAKEMLFKANMPTKQVVEYAVAMVF